ncbi:MAG: yngG2 [Marmoricola sp.]|nr:yngG2 [Marmoricola sp.]
METISIVEVSPRDGLQNEAKPLSPEQRAELVLRAVDAGAKRVEAVSFVHPGRVRQMAGAEEVMAALPRIEGVRYAGLVLNRQGVERALATAVDEINVVVPCTDEMSQRNQGCDMETMMATARDVVAAAREDHRFVTVTAAVAFGCPFSGDVAPDAVRRVAAMAAEEGADEFALADTIGVGVPAQVRQLTESVRTVAPDLALRFHFHNTRNTGYANAVAAVESGARVLDASIGGFGGCPFAPAATGNIATEDVHYLLRRTGYSTGLAHVNLVETATWLGQLLDKRPSALLGRAGDFPERVHASQT